MAPVPLGVLALVLLSLLGTSFEQRVPTSEPVARHFEQSGSTNDDWLNTIRYDGRDRGHAAPPRLQADNRDQPPRFHPGRGVWKGEVPLDRSEFRDWRGADQQMTPMGYQYASHAPHAMDSILRASRPKDDHAMWFSGDNYGRMFSGPNLAGESFTVEAWVKRARTGFTESFLSHGSSALDGGFRFGFTKGDHARFSFSDEDGDTCAVTGGAFAEDVEMGGAQWHHWAATFDAATLEAKIYRDGVQVLGELRPAAKSANVGPFFPCKKATEYRGSGPLFVGRAPPGVTPYSEYFQGAVDELRVWRGAALPRRQILLFMKFAKSTVLELHPAGSHLAGYYDFNEGRGVVAECGLSSPGEPIDLLYGPRWIRGLTTREVAVEDPAASLHVDDWIVHVAGDRDETHPLRDHRGGQSEQGPQLYRYVPLPYAGGGGESFYGLVAGLEGAGGGLGADEWPPPE